ncbi:hypothetical protein IG631_14799 [Alternaria alternata]|nr:hypothetical protein IG631_14799 [Alternaria alternata]
MCNQLLPRPSQGGSENTMTPSPLAHETNARWAELYMPQLESQRRLINLLLRNTRHWTGLVGYKKLGVTKNHPPCFHLHFERKFCQKELFSFAPSRSTAPPIESALGFVARTINHP